MSAQNLHKLDSIFFNIKSHNFSVAKSNLKKLDLGNKITQKQLTLLCDLLYLRETGDSLLLSVSKIPNSKDSFSVALNKLNLGYHELFFNSNKTSAYSHFYQALEHAKRINYKPLEKRAFLAILEYYSKEIARNNENYKLYVEKYENEQLDFYDFLWITVYKLIFYSAQVDGINNDYKKTVNILDSLITKIDINSNIKPTIYFEKALDYQFKNKLDLAFEYYEKALTYSKNKPYYNSLSFSSILKIADYYYKKNDNRKALDYIKNTEKYINKYDTLTSIFYINYYKSKFLYGNKKYQEAYDALLKSDKAGFLLDFRKNSLEISNLQIELETEKKEKENLQLKINIEKEQVEKRNLLIGSIGLLIFLGITAFLIQKNTRKKQKLAEQEKALETQKLATVLKEQELVSIDAMIEGQEKERQRIANDLHDDLGGLMATVKLHFNVLKEKQTPELFDKTTSLLDEAYNKIRGIAHAKNSGVIAKQGLLKAVENMADKISVSNKITVDVIDHGLENRLENSLELTIFRIIQELITNVIKHADASEATIHLTNHDDTLNIMIEDNGKGFNTNQITTKNKGMGISSIDKRIEHLNGKMTIESEHNKGTTIIIDLPI